MSPQDVVVGFIAGVGVCLRAIGTEFVEIRRASPVQPLTARTVDGAFRRSGTIRGLGVYTLHGQGCRFELESGEQIDFDWDREGRAVFDGWRLRWYAVSLDEEFEEGTLVSACRDLVGQGVLMEVKEGWFALRD